MPRLMRSLFERRAPLLAAGLVLLALLATVDERSFGVVPDGREMLSAAAALAFHGEIGVSRDFANAVPRDGGDAFSRYGAGQSLAEVPFLWLARLARAAAPGASSAPLLVLLPLLALAAAAWGVARAAMALGAPAPAPLLLGAGAVLATPLWGYAGSDYSEPLQAALAAAGLALAAAIRLEGTTPRREALAGLALGALPLVKSLLWLVAIPLLAVAFLPPSVRDAKPHRRRSDRTPPRWRVLAWASLPALVWLVLELVRFGRPFGGYPGETFTYPLLTGLLRLTILPNKGLLLHAPLVLLGVLGLALLFRRDRLLGMALGGAAGSVFLTAGAWWAWDGQAGWGPRLVLPAVPLLAAAAAPLLAASRPARLAALPLAGAGLAVNLLGALQPFPAVYALATRVPARPIAEGRAAGTPYEVERDHDGTLLASAPHHLSLTPGWAPVRVHALLLAERWRGGDVAARLAARGLDLTPSFRPLPPAAPAAAYVQATSPFAWPFWGRSWVAPAPGLADPLDEARADQLVRALDTRRWDRALALAREHVARRANDESLALAAEAAQLSGRSDEAAGYLARASDGCHPWHLFVKRRRSEPLDACLPAELRAGFLAGVDAAHLEGIALTAWARRAESGR